MKEERNSQIRLAITMLIAVCLLGIPAKAQYGGGNGTEEDPYQIWTIEQMNSIDHHHEDRNKHFKLMADIDMSAYPEITFNTIGPYYIYDRLTGKITDTLGFKGVFDGNFHIIRNVDVNMPGEKYVGIFGFLDDNGQIKNLGIENVVIIGGAFTGSLAGCSIGTITNCHSTGSVSGSSCIGGLVGEHYKGDITDCYYSGSVTGTNYYIGGIVGMVSSPMGIISHCYSSGQVSGGDRIGGLVGWNHGSIDNSYSIGTVSGNNSVGGLVGQNHNGDIIDSYSTGAVIGVNDVGGLLGKNEYYGSISSIFWDTQTSGIDTPGYGDGLTTDEMQTATTFLDAGWDFVNVWDIGNGQTYPYLRTTIAGDINKDGIVNFLDLCIIAQQWMKSDIEK